MGVAGEYDWLCQIGREREEILKIKYAVCFTSALLRV